MSAPTRVVTARDRRQDLLLAGVMFVGGVISAALSAISGLYDDDQAPLPLALAYVVVIAAPLAVRRRWPSTVAIVVSVAYFLAVSLHVPELYAGNIAMFIALYTVGAWLPDRRRALLVRAAIIAGMLIWLLITVYRDALDAARDEDVFAGAMSPYVAFMMLQVLLNLLYFAGAYYFGERAWAAATERGALERRTADLEREREVTAAQAVALDRVRIARELHDVVAHHVSVMGVQAGAARTVLPGDPASAIGMLEDIEDSARAAIGELHQLLETLRSPGPDDDASGSTVSLADLPALVAASSAAGLPTVLTTVGEPVPVPPLLAVNLYRIAQESLTNARRHAGSGAGADVRLRYLPGEVELEVGNTGRRVLAPRPGLGQLGMRERAIASGGTLESRPREDGGWIVRVRVPLTTGAQLQEARA